MISRIDSNLKEIDRTVGIDEMKTIKLMASMELLKLLELVQFTTSSRRLDGGAYCEAPVGGKCMVSKAKLVLYAFAV